LERTLGKRVSSIIVGGSQFLNFRDLIVVSSRQLIRHHRRYLGAGLAIALGVAGFLSIICLTRELKHNFNENIDLIGGVTIIGIYFDNNNRSYQPQWFRDQTLTAIKQLSGVKELSQSTTNQITAIWHGQQFAVTALMADDAFWRVRKFWPQSGRLFGQDAVVGRKRECILGRELAKNIFGSTHAEGKCVEVGRETYQVNGVLGGVTGGNLANSMVIPLTTAQDRLEGRILADHIYLRCATWDDVDRVAAAIPGIVNTFQSAQELHVEVAREGLKRVRRLAWLIEFLVYLATGATFILGGAGIWNVMMAAVTSRTREIGLKKAMGAEDRDILAQFLSEALLLSAGAAILGALLGRIVIEGTSGIIGRHPPEALYFFGLTIGFLFALLTGVVAGLYPAIRASRLDVITAVRYE
jgi:putative ABC transport system permease protein